MPACGGNMDGLMDVMVGPDGRPATFDGAAWVSQDGRYWWNGAAWQPTARKGGTNLFVLGVGLAVLAAVALAVFGVIKPGSPPAAPVVMGVTHARIDSPTQIEFDYARSSTCAQLDFEVVFYDQAGRAVGDYTSSFVNDVTGGVEHHYVFQTRDTIPSTAVRFTATPTCRA